MAFFQSLSIFTFLLLALAFPFAKAATFEVQNNCGFPVWAAAIPGGGQRLNQGQTWSVNVQAGTTGGRIWARTNCTFDGSGRGQCQTGDCGGVLQCTDCGRPPCTSAEFALNQFNNLDFFGISLMDGFNVPMVFSPTSNGCTSRSIRCTADVNGQCPNELKAPGGCNNPCTVFNTDQFCCRSGKCDTTYLTQYFKYRCPDAYGYLEDARNNNFTCPGGNNYSVVFCASNTTSIVNYAQMHIRNNCSYTVWAAANPGGGRQLNRGETWTLNVTSPRIGRVWGRTNCEFDENGRGRCDSGDCDGLLQCQGVGRAPHTLAQYSIGGQYDLNLFNISVVDGFNVPIEISPVTSTTRTSTSSSKQDCGPIKCEADINEPCPLELRDPGGCNNPCTIFRNDQFCCKSNICQPTSYSNFFKQLCPNALTYPLDNPTSISCPTRITDYNVIFCP